MPAEALPPASQADREIARARALFDALRADDRDVVPASALPAALAAAGLCRSDPRLRSALAALRDADDADAPIDFERFSTAINESFLLIEKALTGRLAIPDFAAFSGEIARIRDEAARDQSGAVADYIPQLARVDPGQFGVAACTIDGQRAALGDSDVPFCVQSCVKAVLYCAALEERGEDVVHRHVGREPSGRSFNALLSLDDEGLPHNPMINAGGIMSCALIGPEVTPADRFDDVVRLLGDLAGGYRPGFSNPTYLSERGTADRNFALGYSMRETGALPIGVDLVAVLEFYFQACSIEMTAAAMSVAAATLANGGICPITGKRVLQPDTVRKCLSLMSSCGMYDFSGEWAFAIGLPAKSGVSGAIFVVIPDVMGLCVWSPRLDSNGNSVRGIRFCRELVRRFNFHAFDLVAGGGGDKRDPRVLGDGRRTVHVDLCWAASKGDLAEIRRLVARGADLDAADYDGRTALHLAASEGHRHVVDFLLGRGVRRDPRDRWGNTPLCDSKREGHADVVARLDDLGIAASA